VLDCPRYSIPPHGLLEFGAGAVRKLPEAMALFGSSRAFVVTDPGIAAAGILDEVRALLTAAGVGVEVFAEVEPNPSVTTLVTAAAQLRAVGDLAVVVVALGGGSSLDAAKSIALSAANPEVPVTQLTYGAPPALPGRPVVAIPTTAGTGSETNGFSVIADPVAQCKLYLGAPSVVPKVAILDPLLTVGLPQRATAATGVDALVHGIESLTSRHRNPVSAAYAHEAIRLVYRALPLAYDDGSDVQARSDMLLGAHLAGAALSISGLGLVHGIAHAVTAHTGAAHGIALAAVLERVLEFNRQASLAQLAEVAFDMGAGRSSQPQTANAGTAIDCAAAFVERVGAACSLAELGCTRDLVPALTSNALGDPVTASARRQPTAAELEELLVAAL
jgi:alcohol dehydrogenase class IV